MDPFAIGDLIVCIILTLSYGTLSLLTYLENMNFSPFKENSIGWWYWPIGLYLLISWYIIITEFFG